MSWWPRSKKKDSICIKSSRSSNMLLKRLHVKHKITSNEWEFKNSKQLKGMSQIPTQLVETITKLHNTYSNTMNYKLHGPSVVCNNSEWLARYSVMLLKASKNMTETEMDDKFKDPKPHLWPWYICLLIWPMSCSRAITEHIHIYRVRKSDCYKAKGYLWDWICPKNIPQRSWVSILIQIYPLTSQRNIEVTIC